MTLAIIATIILTALTTWVVSDIKHYHSEADSNKHALDSADATLRHADETLAEADKVLSR